MPDQDMRTRLAEILSSGGLGYGQISLEILYLLPDDFIKRYTQLWELALGPAGVGDRQGQQMKRDGELGKSRTRTDKKGSVVGAGAGGQGKKWKRMGMEIRNEHALNLKSKVDRRLRAIGRDIQQFLDETREGQLSGRAQKESKRCGSCGKLMETTWVHCPFDGTRIG